MHPTASLLPWRESAASEGVMGFSSPRGVVRGWGIESPDDLSQWLRQHGFQATRPGNHISASGQEHILSLGCGMDARVALLEAVYVIITVEQRSAAGPHGQVCPPLLFSE